MTSSSAIYTARLGAGTPILGQTILLDVIGAAVIGVVSLFGGKGTVTGVFFGVLFLSVVDNGLQLLGQTLSTVYATKGGVTLFAAVTDAIRHNLIKRGKCQRRARMESHPPCQEVMNCSAFRPAGLQPT